MTQAFYAGSHLVPMLNVGATDARFFRRLGITAYGFGLFSRKLTFEEFGRMFHGDDERVDVESLRLSTELLRRSPATCSPDRRSMPIRAVIFDFGGVILTSPFEAFARYEATTGLPEGFLRRLNATNPDTNAWARLERSEVDLAGFAELFEAEAAAAWAHGRRPAVLALLRRAAPARDGRGPAPLPRAAEDRPAHQQLRGRRAGRARRTGAEVEALGHFDVIVESSRVGCASPTRRSTGWCATSWASSPTRPCSSTTSASTSSRPGPWA